MWPALIGAGASLIGGLFGSSSAKSTSDKNIEFQRETNQQNIAHQERTNAMAIQESQANRQLQLDSLKNHYQWQAGDMKQAGLNPILASINSAGTAQGSTAALESPRAQAPHKQDTSHIMLKGLTDSISTALQSMKLKQEQDKIDLEKEIIGFRKDNLQADTELKGVTGANISAKTSAEVYQLTSSAKANDQRVILMQQQGKESEQRIIQSLSEIERIGETINNLKQQIAESKTASERNQTQAQLNGAQSALTAQINTLTQLKQQEQKLDTQAKTLGMTKQETSQMREKKYQKILKWIPPGIAKGLGLATGIAIAAK